MYMRWKKCDVTVVKCKTANPQCTLQSILENNIFKHRYFHNAARYSFCITVVPDVLLSLFVWKDNTIHMKGNTIPLKDTG